MRAAISWPIQPRFLVPSSAFLIRQPRHLKLERRVINLDQTLTRYNGRVIDTGPTSMDHQLNRIVKWI